VKLLAFLSTVSLLAVRFLVFPVSAQAHCPLCVAGAAAGVTLTRWIGVDDSITGVWIGALLGSMSLWFSSWILIKSERLRKWKLRPVIKPFIYILVFATTLWSFYQFKLIIRMSQLFGLDKLTFGMLAGSILFYTIDLIKIKHYFNYQRIVISLGLLSILSLIIYILINFYI
jgi:hypothetical protein